MNLKKILTTTVLAASMLTVSCSEPIELMEFIDGSSSKTNLNGTKISWAWAKGGEEHGYYELGTPQYDFLMDKIDSIERELNCEIEAIIDEDKVNMDAIKIKMMGGTPSHDIITSGGTSDFAVGGLIHSFTDLSSYIDLSDYEKFGPLTSQEAYMYKGEVYGVIPAQ